MPRYALAGVLIGICFPLVAWIISLAGSAFPWSPAGLWHAHQANHVLWIVDLAPLVLGGAGYLVGRLRSRLHLMERQLEALLASAADVLSVVDAAGTICYASPSYQHMLGYAPGDLLGRDFFALVHPDDRARMQAGLLTTLKPAQSSRALECRLHHADGSWRVMEMIGTNRLGDAEIRGIVLSGRDITIHKQANEVRHASEEHFRSVAAAVHDAIITSDAGGAILSWNRGAEAIFGYTATEALGQPLTLIMPERYRAQHQLALERVSAADRTSELDRTIELHGLRKDGSELPIELSLAMWLADEGLFYSAIIRDITQRKRSEERLALQYAATKVLATSATLDEAAPQLLRTICEGLKWDAALFWSIDLQENVMRCRATWQRPDGGFDRTLALSQEISYARGSGLPGWAWDTGHPVTRTDLAETDIDRMQWPVRQALDDGLRGAACFPVLAGGAVHSAIECFSHDVAAPNQEMEQALAAIAAQTGQFVERTQAEAALRHQALHDTLTGLPNRALLQDRLEQALRTAQREQSELALLVVDLDRFKEVNDTLGHHAGDQLLQEVGMRLQGELRASDTVARLGADEFAVLLPGTNAAGAAQVTHVLLAALAAPTVLAEQPISLTASIGIAISPAHGREVTTVLRRADVAMSVAKRNGGGYAVYDSAHDQHNHTRLVLEHELRQAIANAQLVLYYQPTVNLRTGHAERVEALVRWPHPERGLIAPDQFIPLAEQTGLIVPLTQWVLEAALQQCQDWEREGVNLDMAVNLSMRSLHDPALPTTLAWLLRRYGVNPDRLTLEITESALMADPAQARAVVTQLAQLGVHLAIDDFGTGYSSLAYLKQLPVDEVKIDRCFVQSMGQTSTKDSAIVRTIIELGHNLGLGVVAEGVEDRAAWEHLHAAGCDVAQGYYLSRPVPAADLKRWLDTTPWGNNALPR